MVYGIKDKKRLNIELPEDVHRELKLLATGYNMSLTKYIKRMIYNQLQLEKKLGNRGDEQ